MSQLYMLIDEDRVNELIQMLWTSVRGGRRVIFGGGEACERKENLLFTKELIEAGR